PVAARHRASAGAAADRLRGIHRHRLLVSTLHDPAAVRESREARSGAAGGGGRSWCTAADRVSAHHAAAVAAGDTGWLVAGVHSRGWRVRDSNPARTHGSADDRPGALG